MAPSKPKCGSRQFWPRVRSKKMYAKIRSWFDVKQAEILGFPGYKVGMTHITITDNRPNSMTKGTNISWPVTVLECPAIKILSVRFYSKSGYGSAVVGEVIAENLDKILSRKINLPKNKANLKKLSDFESKLDDFMDIKIQVYTQPKVAGVGKKTPEIFELGLGGSVQDKFAFVKENMAKEFRVADVIKSGIKVDVHGVTKGKGFQGVVRRFGVSLRNHKSEKSRRSNVKGAVIPGRVLVGHNMPGRMGVHLRTEYNKDVILVGDDVSKVNPAGGFKHYGNVKSDYVLIKGSVPGPAKRMMILTQPIRGTKGLGDQLQVQHIDIGSKQ
jgi:large subunit ribosomal protein L3